MNRIETPSLAGKLLVAHPALRDPNFSRTVVFMIAHSPDEGAMGFVLNRPSGSKVRDFLSGPEAGFLADLDVRWGGPVGGNQLSFALLQTVEEQEGGRAEVAPVSLKPGMAVEDLAEAAESQGLTVHAFLGYSGWSAGQLEAEIRRRSWIVKKPEQKLFSGGLDALWQNVMRTLGPMFRIEALAPENPWAN